jgi:hypothetical protein
MSLKEMVQGYVSNHNVILTAAAGEGVTTLALYLADVLSNDRLVIYFNPSGDIDRHYVKRYYPRVYKSVLFIQAGLDSLLEFLDSIDYEFDHLIMDPGDMLMTNKTALRSLKGICGINNARMVCTSQIRLDPNTGWQPYSTIESFNKKNGNTVFKYSIWMRKATEDNPFFIAKYIDVFKGVRHGNRFLSRYLVRFDITEGCMIV